MREAERLNLMISDLQADLERCKQSLLSAVTERDEARAEVTRLRALVYAQNEVVKAVRSLRQRGGDNPSRGIWPALHEVFDALDALDQPKS